MAIIRLQSDIERQKRLYYEFDSSDKPLGEGGMGKVYKGRCVDERTVQSPNQKIPDRKTKCVIKTHINIKQNVIFGAKLKPV